MDASPHQQIAQIATQSSVNNTSLVGQLTPPHTPQTASSGGRYLLPPLRIEEQVDPLDTTSIFRSPSTHHHHVALMSPDQHQGLRRQQSLLVNHPVVDYIMVIGGLGYIGSHTTLELLKQGLNVVVVDDLSNAYIDVISRIQRLAQKHCMAHDMVQPMLRYHHVDYCSEEMHSLLRQYASSATSASSPTSKIRSRISGVIHFAAFKSVPESIANPLAYYRNNICGLVQLLATVQEVGIKNFVFSSSATVYGEQANAGRPLQEDDLVHFDQTIVKTETLNGNLTTTATTLVNGARGLTSPYGRTKYFGEAILADVACADPSMRITALRYFNPVGCHPSGILREDPRQTPTNLFPVITRVMNGTQDTLDIYGTDWPTRDGTAVRDFIHVVDLAKGHLAALIAASPVVNPYREPFRAYNLGSGTGMTVAEVVESFEKASHLKIPVVRAPRRDGDVGFCVASTLRAEVELGWKTTRRVDDCAKDAWNATLLERASGTFNLKR